MTRITRHAFLTPGHNCWSLWTANGSKTLTNEGSTHRVMESLVCAIDQMCNDGWRVQDIFVDAGTPTVVMLVREETEG
jgi:hypothetical protein